MRPIDVASSEFDVRVIDLATNTIIASPNAQLDVEQGDEQLDSFMVNWTIGPRRCI